MKKVIMLIMLGLITTVQAAPEVRHITPPRLEVHNIGTKILCNRPMRLGAPAMYVEEQHGKIIAHNYGHGGSGWTLGPGAAKYVIGKLDKTIKNKGLAKTEPITVIGAGVLGMLSALELHNIGYKNINIIAESFDNLASHNAAGLLAPVSMDNMENNSEAQKLINDIGFSAYKFYKNIALGNNKQIKSGARILTSYWENREASGLEPYVGVVMQDAKEVILDFGNGIKRPMVAYDDGIFMDTHSLMQSLRHTLKDLNINFKQQRVKKISELKHKVIVNCTGFGAKELLQDSNLIQVQGHLMMLKNQKPEDLNYMILIYLNSGKTKDGAKIKRSFYMFPKTLADAPENDIGVLGGTFIEGATTANLEEFDIMLHSAKKFYGIK